MYENSSKELREVFTLSRNFRNFLIRFILRRMNGFICLNEKEIVGVVFLHYSRSQGKNDKTLGIMVKENHQRRGIGKKLMYAILKNQNKVMVDVREYNKKAIKFYKSFGFKESYRVIKMERELK
ncbi:unnamed protein product [marine sediment metagenome]|uniref:N-acetyltransferase domain-containing protein n=1 Tax=marine sediment metagenome TaxID=412755 RepID=X0W1I3_9ZZZZ